MKRLITLILVAALVSAFAPVAAEADPTPPQKEEGTVLLPGPGPNGETTGGCWTGWPRRFWIFTNGATAGPFGSMIEIDKSTWNGKFKLDVVGGAQGTEDLDVTFYVDPGKVDPVNDPAQQGGIIQSTAYLTREAGGESGTVPPKATLGLICLAIGSGANADWTYTATPKKK